MEYYFALTVTSGAFHTAFIETPQRVDRTGATPRTVITVNFIKPTQKPATRSGAGTDRGT